MSPCAIGGSQSAGPCWNSATISPYATVLSQDAWPVMVWARQETVSMDRIG